MIESPIVAQFRGELNQPEDTRFGIAVSKFNEAITNNLLKGCLEAFSEHNVKQIEIVWCPGAFELPLVVEYMINTDRYDAIVALGAVIRGETYHFETISDACVSGLQKVAQETLIPVALGVITPENLAQARERSESGPKNKGREAGLAALEMAGLIRELFNLPPI